MATTLAEPVESHGMDWTFAETPAGRSLGLALRPGVRGKCPRCGLGRLFVRF
jgi:uncharacterized protein (DUF983 family)